MRQPVVDTLHICDALRKTGMDRDQAEGLARVLGEELGAHVAVQSDLESGFQGVRSDLGARIQAVDAKVDACNQKLTFVVTGFGILLSVLTVVSGMGWLQRPPTTPVMDAAAPPALQTVAPRAGARVGDERFIGSVRSDRIVRGNPREQSSGSSEADYSSRIR